jgi:uncharacterized protein DUF4252
MSPLTPKTFVAHGSVVSFEEVSSSILPEVPMRLPYLKTLVCCFVLAVAPAVSAQNAKLKIDHLEKLAAKASEVADVTLDGPLLQLAAKFLSSEDVDEQGVQELIKGLKGVYVKSFEFDREGAYSSTDLDSVREQLRGPGWSRMVNVQSKEQKELVEIYTMTEGEKITGLAVVTAEPQELTVVNIVGPISLDKLSKLGGHMGIPKVDLKDKASKK